MYCGAGGHELHRERDQGCMDISVSSSLFCLHLRLLLPAEFTVDMRITESASSGQTQRLKSPNTHCSTQTHTDTHISSALAAPEECFLHRWCEKIRCFHSDTLMKLSAPPFPLPPSSSSSSLHFNFRHRSLLLLLPAAPTHLQHSCHRPLPPSPPLFLSPACSRLFFNVLIDSRSGHCPHPPHPRVPLQLPDLSCLIRPSFALSSSFLH